MLKNITKLDIVVVYLFTFIFHRSMKKRKPVGYRACQEDTYSYVPSPN